MDPKNLLFIISDQHSRRLSGCYGNPTIQTPNIDRLAESGTRFTSAYTCCPICVPARASLATGRYVHQIGYWDNSFAYDGKIPSWGHRLRQQGYQVDSIGKLHFKGQGSDHGFTQEIEPLNVVDGIGDILSCIRDDPPFRKNRTGITEAGTGTSTYLQYDKRNADNACRWLAEHRTDRKPWCLFLSFVCPHPPYISPEDTFNLYPLNKIPLAPQWHQEEWPDHSEINYFRQFSDFTRPFSESTLRNVNAAYYGVCTSLDRQIGRILDAVEENNLCHKTRIIYTSDHGECLGARGLFGKRTLYEESSGIPFILSGPDVPAAKTSTTPISLIDCFPTILEAMGASADVEDRDLPGISLWQVAQEPDIDRKVFSEYHAVGSRNAAYMLRSRQYKLIHYVNAPSQLFDLEKDPNECSDLSEETDHKPVLEKLERYLRNILDPNATNTQAKADQKYRIEKFGGQDVVRKRGAFVNSPVPGESPKFLPYA